PSWGHHPSTRSTRDDFPIRTAPRRPGSTPTRTTQAPALAHPQFERGGHRYLPRCPRSAEFCRRKTNVTYLNVATNTHGAEKAHSYTAHYNASTVHIPT